jgi:hypothetical protein
MPTRDEVIAWLKMQREAYNSTVAFWRTRKAAPLSPWVKHPHPHPIDIEKARSMQDEGEAKAIATAATIQAALDLLAPTDTDKHIEMLREALGKIEEGCRRQLCSPLEYANDHYCLDRCITDAAIALAAPTPKLKLRPMSELDKETKALFWMDQLGGLVVGRWDSNISQWVLPEGTFVFDFNCIGWLPLPQVSK